MKNLMTNDNKDHSLLLSNLKEEELFYIYDENLNKIGIKKRKFVHKEGDWHRGIQLNVICHDEILLQVRSDKVDIGKNLIDQSLATQLIVNDNEDEIIALKRGLKEELGITPDLTKIKKLFDRVKIVKTYEYDESLFNREFVSLYEWRVDEKNDFKPNSDKVKELFWMNLDNLKEISKSDPHVFTKTFHMWITNFM